MKLYMEKSSYVYSHQYRKGLSYYAYLALVTNKIKASSREVSNWQLRSESYFKWLAYPFSSIDCKLSLSNMLCHQSTQVSRPP
jgi:hypothetical protein